jgi:hypothetical protein
VKPPSDLYAARVQLFAEGRRRGFLRIEEIDGAIPRDTQSAVERWLMLYALQTIGVEIRQASEGSPIPQTG